MDTTYDLAVIGAGPGGYVSAIRAAQLGMSVVVIEADALGGTCLNRGCIPTKSILHSAGLYEELLNGQKFGIHADGLRFDLDEIYTRKNQVIAQLREGIQQLLEANHVQLLRGRARVTDPHTVVVQGEEQTTLTAKHILVAVGSAPARPPIPGIDLPGVLSSNDLLAETPPRFQRLVIIGGGVIGVEFATAFRTFGCEVTIVEAMPRILPTMDREIGQNLSMILKRRGAAIHTSATVQALEQTEHGLACRFVKNGTETVVEADAVLVAIGRKAALDGLFAPGAEPERRRGLVVNEHFQTSIPSIYAIGDVVDGGIQLAHVASAQGCNAVAHMAGKAAHIDLSTVPSCIYTQPEIAAVGLSPDQAKEKGILIQVGKYVMNGNAKTIIEHQERSFIKLLFHADTHVLLGAQMMCARATDLISELSTAIANGLTVEQLSAVIRPHPTYTEAVTEAVEAFDHTAIHIAPM